MPLGSAVASVFVEIGADSSKLSRGFGDAERRLSESEARLMQMGAGMERAGQTMTRNLTLPLVVAGAAALKFAVDFDTSMSRIQGLVGLSGEEVAGMRDHVLELAGETTRAPQELADALYFITSAGLRGQTALDALEVSAKAAAAGLGETEVVAGAITSAMNAYGHDVLGAAEATDILVATVRSGKVEAADLAPQIGRVADMAATLGVEFSEVGGLMAYFTSTTGSAELAGTRFDGIMRKLVRTTPQFEQGLNAVGTSSEELRGIVADQGLVPALQFLQERFGGNAQAAANLFEEGQAVAGVLAILNDRTGSLDGILDDVSDSTGALDNAFGAFAESAGFEASQSFAEIQVALIAIGDVLAPIAADIANFVAGFAAGFAALPRPVLALVTAFGGLLAVAGPMLWAAGKAVQAWGRLGQVLPMVQSGIVAFGRSMGTMIGRLAAINPYITAAVASLAAFYLLMQSESTRTSNNFDEVADSLEEVMVQAGSAEAGLRSFLAQSIDGDQATEMERLGLTVEAVAKALEGTDDDWADFVAGLEGEGISDELAGTLGVLREVLPGVVDGFDALESTGAAGVLGEIGGEASEAEQAIEDLEAAWAGFNDLISDTQAEIAARDALRSLGETAMGALEGGVDAAEFDAITGEALAYAEALRTLAESHNKNEDGVLRADAANRELLDSMRATRQFIPEQMLPMWDALTAELEEEIVPTVDGRPALDEIDTTTRQGQRLWVRTFRATLDANIQQALDAIAEATRAGEEFARRSFTAHVNIAQGPGGNAGGIGGLGGHGTDEERFVATVPYGSGQRAVIDVMTPTGPVDVSGPGTSVGSRGGTGERDQPVTMVMDGEVVAQAVIRRLDESGAFD